ncbi:MAG: DUF2781 domain-containing protein [Spirochaetales bacterium]|nr:DUF2781 domain-containing protein [Spirochaetales bacterium]
MRQPIPLKQRPLDVVILVFFFINILCITYIVDFEQIANPEPVVPGNSPSSYPLWPPSALVNLVHWWGNNFDPVLLARPAWWKATIWIDALLFGPFYLIAIYAFIKGKEWIRLPSIIYSSVLWTNVTIILSEEIWGSHASPQLGIVLLANAPWFIFPVFIIARMWKTDHPFTSEKTTTPGGD